MKWQINCAPSIFAAVTGDETVYTTHLLNVELQDDLDVALREYWKAVLSRGVEDAAEEWSTLHFTYEEDNVGSITATFETQAQNERPFVYKLSIERMRAAYERSVSAGSEDVVRFLSQLESQRNTFIRRLEQTAHSGDNRSLLATLKKKHPFRVVITGEDPSDWQTELDI